MMQKAATGLDADARGWLWLIHSRKAHYFDNSLFSLCGRWRVEDISAALDNNHTLPDNCEHCKRIFNNKTLK